MWLMAGGLLGVQSRANLPHRPGPVFPEGIRDKLSSAYPPAFNYRFDRRWRNRQPHANPPIW
jgi:hypothetical protein